MWNLFLFLLCGFFCDFENGSFDQFVTNLRMPPNIENFCFVRFKMPDYDLIRSARQNKTM